MDNLGVVKTKATPSVAIIIQASYEYLQVHTYVVMAMLLLRCIKHVVKMYKRRRDVGQI